MPDPMDLVSGTPEMVDHTEWLRRRMGAEYTIRYSPWNGTAWSGRPAVRPTEVQVAAALASGFPGWAVAEVLAAYDVIGADPDGETPDAP